MIDFSHQLPFQVSQVYMQNISVNIGIVVHPGTLQVTKPTLNGSPLVDTVYKDFQVLDATGQSKVIIKITHGSKGGYTRYELVPIISAEIDVGDPENSDTITSMVIAELEWDSDNYVLSVDQKLSSDLYPLIFGTQDP